MAIPKVDLGRMFAAITERSDGPHDVGYLNRYSGEIIFVASVKDAKAWFGLPGLETAATNAAVERNPSDWAEIPKLTRKDKGSEEEFIKKFLREEGIEAELSF